MGLSYHKTICIDFKSENFYQLCLESPDLFKSHIALVLAKHPELFPPAMQQGYCLYGYTRRSKKQDSLCAVSELLMGKSIRFALLL